MDISCYGDHKYHDYIPLGEEFKAANESTAAEVHKVIAISTPISEFSQQIV
jgi:hypothetical protein